MRTSFFLVPAAFALTTLALRSHGDPRTREEVAHERSTGHVAEVRRIQAHFDSVLGELQERDVTHLPAGQRANRAQLMAVLRDYRDRGVFPHNYDFPGEAMPYFVDRRTGTLCAVAHLMESAGRRDLVDLVAAANNNVWVPQLAGNAEFASWLDAHGLTLEEAARIQVPYVEDGSPIVGVFGSRDGAYFVGSSIAFGTTAAAALWNAWGNRDGHRRAGTILGFATSAVALAFGGAAMRDPAAPAGVGEATVVSGIVGAYFSTRGLLRNRQSVAARQVVERGRVARASLSPLLPVPGGRGAGVAINVSF
jgi:hypothetical protein